MREINVTVIGSGSTYCPELVDGFLQAQLRIHGTQVLGRRKSILVESGRKWEAGMWLFWKSDTKNHETSYLSRFAPICPRKQGCPSLR